MAAKKKTEEDHANDLYKQAMSQGGQNSELHSITQKLSSFTDMANSLKSTIDDVASEPASLATTSDSTGELKA